VFAGAEAKLNSSVIADHSICAWLRMNLPVKPCAAFLIRTRSWTPDQRTWKETIAGVGGAPPPNNALGML